jgi:hypothetical protein
MQITRQIALLALFAVAVPGLTRAAVTQDSSLLRNTGDLIDLCSAAPSDPLYTAAVNFCHGFAVGVFRVLNQEEAALRSRRLFCPPNPMPSRDQSIADFVQWAKATPGQINQQPADSIALFLSQRYPCPGAGKSSGRGGR